MADALLRRVTRDGRYDRALPVIGVLILAFDVLYNQFLTTTPQILSTDIMVIGLGLTLIAFPFVPAKFQRERNFAVLFFSLLTLIFGVPLLILRVGHDPYASVDEYTAALLAPQLSAALNALGVSSSYSGNVLYYMDQTTGNLASVYIATSCSGLYSMSIFIAAFLSLVMSEYSRFTWRVAALMGAGVAVAYLANLLRMVIIVEMGYHYGSEALLFTHANLGDLIFLAWVAPFVWLSYRVLDPSAARASPIDPDAFEAALREQGIDPAGVTEADWFCAACFLKLDAAAGHAGVSACPRCGASLA